MARRKTTEIKHTYEVPERASTKTSLKVKWQLWMILKNTGFNIASESQIKLPNGLQQGLGLYYMQGF